MSRITRRNCLQGTVTALTTAALGTPASSAGSTPMRKELPGSRGIQLAELFKPNEDHKIRLAAQIGIGHAIVGVTDALSKVPRDGYLETIEQINADFKSKGLTIAGVESHPVPAEKIKLGVDGRDEEIENYIAAIQALSKAGIPMICYNWMAGLGWYRTKTDVPDRGGALLSEFDNNDAKRQGLTRWGEIPEEKIWSNLEYFLKAVIPVAEKANVQMALHPDDPPISPLRGIGRILTSAKNYRRVMDIVPSPVNGITFFRETFHDIGPTDLARMLKIYHDAGFDGPMRPDHAPTLDGESNDNPGYAMGGKVLAIGYMKGVMDAYGIAYR